MNKKLKTFTIQADLTLQVGLSIKAESLEDAVQQSKELKELDFVTIKDEFQDGSMKIRGVWENDY